MSRSCHSATFSSAGLRVAAQQAREAAQVLRQDRVLLVRHRRRALLALPKASSASPTSVRCQWRTFERELLDRGAEQRERGEAPRRGGRARRSASATVSGRSPSLASASRLDRRVEVARRCRPRRRSCRPRSRRARARPARGARARARRRSRANDQAGGDRLGVDAVRAADHRRRARARRRARRQRGAQLVDAARGSGRVAAHELDRERGVEHVGRRHARGAASAPARRRAPRRGSGTRSRRGACAPRSRGCARR